MPDDDRQRPSDAVEVQERLAALLARVPHTVLEHPYADTGLAVAAARGTPVEIGGKSLVMKLDRGLGFAMLVVGGGDRRIDNLALRRHLRVRRYRFATVEELHALTGLAPGCVPPFGRPVFDLPLFVDTSVAQRSEIAFSAASHTRSIRMAVSDWLAVARPTDIFAFARDDGG